MFAQPAEHPKNELLSLEVKTASTSRGQLLVFISQPAIDFSIWRDWQKTMEKRWACCCRLLTLGCSNLLSLRADCQLVQSHAQPHWAGASQSPGCNPVGMDEEARHTMIEASGFLEQS